MFEHNDISMIFAYKCIVFVLKFQEKKYGKNTVFNAVFFPYNS